MAQVRLTGPAGETRALDISVVPLRDRSGKLRGFAGSAVDVTALLAASFPMEGQVTLGAIMVVMVLIVALSFLWLRHHGLPHEQMAV